MTMPRVLWLGNVDYPGNDYAPDAHCTWGDYTFPRGVPVEVTDPHILHKAKTNRFFRLIEDGVPFGPATGRVDYNLGTPLDPVIEAHTPPKRSHKKKVVPP